MKTEPHPRRAVPARSSKTTPPRQTVLRGTPPALRPRHRCVGGRVTRVDEDRADQKRVDRNSKAVCTGKDTQHGDGTAAFGRLQSERTMIAADPKSRYCRRSGADFAYRSVTESHPCDEQTGEHERMDVMIHRNWCCSAETR